LAEDAGKINPTDDLSDVWREIGDSSATQPTPVTFRQAVSRWYGNTPGGFDAAVENSQRALRQHGVVYPHSNSPAYGEWSPEMVDSEAPVRIDPKLDVSGSRGRYGTRGVSINPVMLEATKARNSTLEHELTHHLTAGKAFHATDPLAVQRMGNSWARFDGTPDGSATLSLNPRLAAQYDASQPASVQSAAEEILRPLANTEQYAMKRVELDPRIAEVRRRYAFHTGKDVVAPEDAAEAWDWYRSRRGQFENLSSPHERPSMTEQQFDIYDSLPPESKQIMFKRMTQVPAVLAPVAAGAAASSEQESVISNLLRK
jgi:hypothetical protein